MLYLILGLLMIRSLTIYEIKTTLEKKISPFYAASFGSIQHAIKNLLSNQQIGFLEKVENGRKKKEYFITPAGKEIFYTWMNSEIQVNKFNNEALVRVFFFGFIPKKDRLRLIKNYIAQLQIEYQEMLSFQYSLQIPDAFRDKKEIVVYQLETLDYAIHELKNEIAWFKRLLNKIEEENY